MHWHGGGLVFIMVWVPHTVLCEELTQCCLLSWGMTLMPPTPTRVLSYSSDRWLVQAEQPETVHQCQPAYQPHLRPHTGNNMSIKPDCLLKFHDYDKTYCQRKDKKPVKLVTFQKLMINKLLIAIKNIWQRPDCTVILAQNLTLNFMQKIQYNLKSPK